MVRVALSVAVIGTIGFAGGDLTKYERGDDNSAYIFALKEEFATLKDKISKLEESKSKLPF